MGKPSSTRTSTASTIRILASAATLATAAAGPAMAQSFQSGFVDALCRNGAYLLTAIEAGQYDALGDYSASVRTDQIPGYVGQLYIYGFTRTADPASPRCTSYTQRPSARGLVSICEDAPVTRNGAQLTRAGWTLKGC